MRINDPKTWSKIALKFLYAYARKHEIFSAEMVRNAADEKVPRPASLRSWGAIMIKGSKLGWIKQCGFTKVINPKAHMANATIWESCLMKGEKDESDR
jgi:hypothetical protein